MPEGDKAYDKPTKSVDGSDNGHSSQDAANDKPLHQQAAKALSSPASLYADPALMTLYAALTPLTIVGNRDSAAGQATSKAGSNAVDSTAGAILASDAEKTGALSPDSQRQVRGLGEDPNPNASGQEKKLIRYFKPIEIKIKGIADGSIAGGPANLEEAKATFLKAFKDRGGKVQDAEKYLDQMIKDNHELAEYGRKHHEKIHYISDKRMAACINELTKVCTTKRTRTAAELTQGQVNRRLLEIIEILGDPNHKVAQGQIGSCALMASVHYEVVHAPEELARIARKVLTTGKYRGDFTKDDMAARNGVNAGNMLLGTAQLRATYSQKHLTSGYGGTDTENQAAGIKRITRGKAHIYYDTHKLKQHGAVLSYWPGHALVKVLDIKRKGGELLAYKKEDNTWDGWSDGSWTTV